MKKKRIKTVQQYGLISNLRLSGTLESQVLRDVRFRLKSFGRKDAGYKKFYIVTPNPEQAILAQKDKEFAKILNSATFSLADGVGLVQAVKFLSLPRVKNKAVGFFVYFFQGLKVGLSTFFNKNWLQSEIKVIHGRQMMVDLVKLANKLGWRVFLLGDRQKSAQKAQKALQNNYKRVKFASIEGPDLKVDASPSSKEDEEIETRAINAISSSKPHILFIGFGAPLQEKWLYKHISKLDIGGAMVVGGALDYISKKVMFPPAWVSKLELEWLWRLVTQKGRLKRVLTAFPLFPLKVFVHKLANTP
jgi:N-acetylglucosaminyldiphosphoundecaprenol N-acetyl-beta-D-mannosaminyltransferase